MAQPSIVYNYQSGSINTINFIGQLIALLKKIRKIPFRHILCEDDESSASGESIALDHLTIESLT